MGYEFEVDIYNDKTYKWEMLYYGDSKKIAFKELKKEKKNGKTVRLIWR